MRDLLLGSMVQAATYTGTIILRNLHKIGHLPLEQKSQGEWITPLDHLAEELLIAELKKSNPSFGIDSELGQQGDNEENYFILDSINGTHNMISHNPHWCISIAAVVKGKLSYAVIYDPHRDETFSASTGKGTHFNKTRVRVSQQRELRNTLVATSLPYHNPEYKRTFWSHTARLSSDIRELRMTGSTALDFAWTCCGRLDATYAYGIKKWSIAAGAFLVQEAGGAVQTISGKDPESFEGNLVASNVYLMPSLLKLLK
ncbi:MAG: inositol monophosphatase family protein [bacterium]